MVCVVCCVRVWVWLKKSRNTHVLCESVQDEKLLCAECAGVPKLAAHKYSDICYCRNGRDGLAYGALKLSALHLSPVDYFGNYIFEISIQNCITCTINCASTLSFI